MTKNFAQILGFAAHDPKRSGNSNTACVRLLVETNERGRDRLTGENRDCTQFHTVVFWDRLADLAADVVRKGSHILVSGPIESRQYESKGVTHVVWEIHARELLLLDPRTNEIGDSDPTVSARQTSLAR